MMNERVVGETQSRTNKMIWGGIRGLVFGLPYLLILFAVCVVIFVSPKTDKVEGLILWLERMSRSDDSSESNIFLLVVSCEIFLLALVIMIKVA